MAPRRAPDFAFCVLIHKNQKLTLGARFRRISDRAPDFLAVQLSLMACLTRIAMQLNIYQWITFVLDELFSSMALET